MDQVDRPAAEAALPPTAEELPPPVRPPAAPTVDSFSHLMRSLLQASALFVIGFLFIRTFALEPFGNGNPHERLLPAIQRQCTHGNKAGAQAKGHQIDD